MVCPTHLGWRPSSLRVVCPTFLLSPDRSTFSCPWHCCCRCCHHHLKWGLQNKLCLRNYFLYAHKQRVVHKCQSNHCAITPELNWVCHWSLKHFVQNYLPFIFIHHSCVTLGHETENCCFSRTEEHGILGLSGRRFLSKSRPNFVFLSSLSF